MTPVFVCLTSTGIALARRLAPDFPGAVVHGLEGRTSGTDVSFAKTLPHLQELFRNDHPIIGVCAAGILIRAVAPLVQNKQIDPPVIALADDGSCVVPLLGGHRGGNALAEQIAKALEIDASVTTAGDRRFGFALDDPPIGWRVGDTGSVKQVTAALLAGESVGVIDETPTGISANWLTKRNLDFATVQQDLNIRLTANSVEVDKKSVVLHPAILGLGVGCERGADPDELLALVEEVLRAQGLSRNAIACVGTIDLKGDEPAVIALAETFGVPLRLFSADALEQETSRVANPSDYVFETVGCHSVSEAAALAASGPKAELIAPKTKGKRTTCAIAQAAEIIDVTAAGKSRGRLTVIGIGPGTADWRAPEATNAVARASDLVGYGLYLDLLGDLTLGKQRHDYPLGKETDRVAAALDLAAEGREVALISSGDAGIYAMASLVFELIDIENRDDWKRLDVQVVPGISALQAAAARTGAPLGHDFCTVSLSDLLTPWSVIERRLEAAAQGDFVIALYNPVSKKRRDHLETARDILLKHRPAETPVIIARNLGRTDEKVDVLPLKDLKVDMVDMLSLVMIGSSETRTVSIAGETRVYTPRGYGDKK
ncbi:MAG: precorrin-3B C(17)-methyltransferase [Rhodospirillaceae bacterium]|jgi:cobalt-precorrin 5A hydrolase / precorrin-3B C17-methyltransferase|nr:precorrin-3B C(17)-methyltransferase [Rhodospirillaceae bacterium]